MYVKYNKDINYMTGYLKNIKFGLKSTYEKIDFDYNFDNCFFGDWHFLGAKKMCFV